MDKSWGTFELLRRFPIHTYPAPPLTPQTTLDACFQNFFPSLNFVQGGGRENYKKISRMLHGFMIRLCTDNLFSPQIFTEGRREGGSVQRLFYKGAQKIEKIMNTIMNTEIMNTFPKTELKYRRKQYDRYCLILLRMIIVSLVDYVITPRKMKTTWKNIGRN